MKNGGLVAICEIFKTFWQMEKLLVKDDSKNHLFKGPVIPFEAMVEYYPISARDPSRLHQFGKKILLIAGGIWKGDLQRSIDATKG